MRIAGDEVFLYQKLRKAVRCEDISIHCAVSKLRDKRRDETPGEIDDHRAGDGFCVVEVNLKRQNHDAVPGLGDVGRAVHHDVHAAAQYNLRAYVTPSMFEGALDFEGETWRIRQDGYLWQGDEY